MFRKKEAVVNIKFNRPLDSGQFFVIKANEAEQQILEWFPKNVKVNKVDGYGPPGNFDIIVGGSLVHNHLHLNHGFLKGASEERQAFVRKAITDALKGEAPIGVEEDVRQAALKAAEEAEKQVQEQRAAEEAAQQEKAEQEAKAKALAEAEAKRKADEKRQAVAKAKARAKAKAEAEAKAKAEAEAKAKEEVEKAEAEAKARENAAKAEAEEQARVLAEKAKAEADAVAKAEEDARQREAERKGKESKVAESAATVQLAELAPAPEGQVTANAANTKLDKNQRSPSSTFWWSFCCRDSANDGDVQGDLPHKYLD